MAAVSTCALSAPRSLKSFDGLRASSAAPSQIVKFAPLKAKGALGARCDYIGSPTNLIMVSSIAACFVAGRFGLAPSANRKTSPFLKLQDRDTGLGTTDPAGFTGTDVLAFGAVGHVLGVGLVFAAKYLGSI
eukprot:TRINITY_DN3043_c0_g1_i1.p1 TRINITY_DN3043_c0_g1~~TRINITY_DN3043_c0_g1_i1.p1  ORF type:complete len:132 (-),score=15.21 TRINITY_DN3043_c0_g1_i1:69-464(-)